MVVPPRWGARVGYRQYYDPHFPKGDAGLLRLEMRDTRCEGAGLTAVIPIRWLKYIAPYRVGKSTLSSA